MYRCTRGLREALNWSPIIQTTSSHSAKEFQRIFEKNLKENSKNLKKKFYSQENLLLILLESAGIRLYLPFSSIDLEHQTEFRMVPNEGLIEALLPENPRKSRTFQTFQRLFRTVWKFGDQNYKICVAKFHLFHNRKKIINTIIYIYIYSFLIERRPPTLKTLKTNTVNIVLRGLRGWPEIGSPLFREARATRTRPITFSQLGHSSNFIH